MYAYLLYRLLFVALTSHSYYYYFRNSIYYKLYGKMMKIFTYFTYLFYWSLALYAGVVNFS